MKVQPYFTGLKKTLTSTLGVAALTLAQPAEVTAQIPLAKPLIKQAKPLQKGLQIKNIQDLKAFQKALIKEERELASAVSSWSYELQILGVFNFAVLADDKGNQTKASRKLFKDAGDLWSLYKTFNRIRENQPKHPPPAEHIAIFKAIAEQTAQVHMILEKGFPKWIEPNAFALRKTKIGRFFAADPKMYDEKAAFKDAFGTVTRYKKNYMRVRQLTPKVLSHVELYNQAAKRLKQKPYKAYWGLDLEYMTALNRQMNRQRPKNN